MDVGFLGLGQMGAAIAERLLDASAGLHVYDPNDVAMAPFVLRGAVDHESARSVANAARVVFACLPNGAVSELVAAEIVAGSAVRTYVEMSTIGSPAMARVQALLEPRGVSLNPTPNPVFDTLGQISLYINDFQ